MNTNETDHLMQVPSKPSRVTITQQEGYITATYFDTFGHRFWLVGSYDWGDINQSLEVAREKFGDIKVKGED